MIDYYALLDIPKTASLEDIKKAYKRQALRSHPDKNPNETTTFQNIAQAYYVLSNEHLRNKYNEQLEKNKQEQEPEVNASELFGSIFEELLVEEIGVTSTFWAYVGGISGVCLGFIVGNVPGMLVGGVACLILGYTGSMLGKIRDKKGISVYEVFQKLGKKQKIEILTRLAKAIV
jgi:curved DNA-binding protein CbpA